MSLNKRIEVLEIKEDKAVTDSNDALEKGDMEEAYRLDKLATRYGNELMALLNKRDRRQG